MEIKDLKSFIKDNSNVENLYYTGLKERTLESKFEYIKEHFTYDIMNSWNALESIANNVKIWNLKLTNEQSDKFFELLDVDNNYVYDSLNFTIKDFEDITDTDIFFNGRNGGYLVIVPKFSKYNKNMNILDLFFSDNIYDYETLKEFKKDSLDTSYGYTNEDINKNLEECYYLLKSFDLLCDLLREELIYILDNAEIKEEKKMVEKIEKYIEI
mgnify:CR=1 FL=1